MQLNSYFVVLVALILVAGLCFLISGLSLWLGPKKLNKIKSEVYECGIPVQNSASINISVKFYLVAILFIIFDIETVFLYLWAYSFGHLGWFGIIEAGVFILTLLIGYFYVVKRKALQWE